MVTINFEKNGETYFAEVFVDVGEDGPPGTALTFVSEASDGLFDSFRAQVLQQLLIGALKMLDTGLTLNYSEVYDIEEEFATNSDVLQGPWGND